MKFVNGTASDTYDVVVVGSGAGALTAAATAARAGKSVVVLEKSDLLGGTSAVSGGMLWVADNHHAREAGITDSKAAAAEYVRAVARGRGREELLDAALDYGDQMLRFVEEECGVRFIFLDNFPDYRQDLPGAVDGRPHRGTRAVQQHRKPWAASPPTSARTAAHRSPCRNTRTGARSPSSPGTN